LYLGTHVVAHTQTADHPYQGAAAAAAVIFVLLCCCHMCPDELPPDQQEAAWQSTRRWLRKQPLLAHLLPAPWQQQRQQQQQSLMLLPGPVNGTDADLDDDTSSGVPGVKLAQLSSGQGAAAAAAAAGHAAGLTLLQLKRNMLKVHALVAGALQVGGGGQPDECVHS
jgi:hypothetical protein